MRKKKIVVSLTEEIIEILDKYAKSKGGTRSYTLELILRGELEPPIKRKREAVKF